MFRFPARLQMLSLLRSTYIGTRAEPASYWMAAGAIFLGSKAVGHEVELYSYLMKLRMRGAIPSLPSYAFVACTGTAWPFIVAVHFLCIEHDLRIQVLHSLLRSFVDFNHNELRWIYEYIKAKGGRVFSSTLMYYCRSRISVPIPLAARSEAWACRPRLLASGVRIPPESWMSVSYGCCVLSGRGLCDDRITRPDASYRLWCVSLSGIRYNNDLQHIQWVGRRNKWYKHKLDAKIKVY